MTPKRLQSTLLIAAVTLLGVGPTAALAKEPVDFFGNQPNRYGTLGGQFGGPAPLGGSPGAVAVNDSGAGPADAGDVYVIDPLGNRVQRFGRDDAGTPADTTDDSYFFVSAWGADVVQAGGSGDQGGELDASYEVCSVASQCKAGIAAAGNGSLDFPVTQFPPFGVSVGRAGIAVDSDTGYVYVSDVGNHRVNVYEGDGIFLRSFGWGVTASGPGDVAGADETQLLTVKAEGGKFSLEFEGETTGARAESKGCTQPGSNTFDVLAAASGSFEVGQVITTSGLQAGIYPPGTAITAIDGQTLTLSQSALLNRCQPTFHGHDLDFDATAQQVEAALNALPTIGGAGSSVSVTGGPGNAGGSTPYSIAFDGGPLAGEDVPTLVLPPVGLTGGGASAGVAEAVPGGAFEICVAADGDACRAGGEGGGVGAIGAGRGVAVSPPDGDTASGAVFLADEGKHRLAAYELDGASPFNFGSGFNQIAGNHSSPRYVAVDSRGIVYADDYEENGPEFEDDERLIKRYDSENANGTGVGFLDPIREGVDEVQRLTIDATAGAFRLSFDPDGAGPAPAETTVDIPHDALNGGSRRHCPGTCAEPPPIDTVFEALEALPSIGPNDVEVTGGPQTDSAPYTITFGYGLGAADVAQLTATDGSVPLTGGTGASVQTLTEGESGLAPLRNVGLAVDPDGDGAGPDTDVLYALRTFGPQGVIQQFGPANPPGLTAPPTADDGRHGFAGIVYGEPTGGLATEPATGRLYVSAPGRTADAGSGVYVLDEANPLPPTVSLDSLSGATPTTITANATIDPGGPPDTSYRLEYSDDDGASWRALPEVVLGSQDSPQAVNATIDGGPAGLEPDTAYTVRVVIRRRFSSEIESNQLTAATLPGPPIVETAGAPVRTTTSAQLGGRLVPRNNSTSYRFEYGDQGPCDANPCDSSPARAAGDGAVYVRVAERVEGLAPDTTYHYRLLAENGTGGEVSGGDMTLTTRAGDELPNQSDEYPGPPDSDRAWEMVSMPDSGGNPVGVAQAFSDAGDRAIYSLSGGTPFSDTGSFFSLYFAERPPGAHPREGWQTRLITPARELLSGADWPVFDGTYGRNDLESVVSANDQNGKGPLWRLNASAPPQPLFAPEPPTQFSGSGYPYGTSADTSTVITRLQGGVIDPAFPAAGAVGNLYDVGSGSPELVSVMPNGSAPACGAVVPSGGGSSPPAVLTSSWIAADGSYAFFQSPGSACGSAPQLYLRDLEAEQTKLVSGPALGGLGCEASLVKGTPGAVFFVTTSRLVAADEEPPGGCGSGEGKDVYRYGLAGGELSCVTCAGGGSADVITGTGNPEYPVQIKVSADGSRVYFLSSTPLVPGVPQGSSIYRAEVGGGIAYVATPGGHGSGFNDFSDLTPDGSRLVLVSKAAALDPLGGTATNGGTTQVYLYDDSDGSLTCASCPQSGAAPLAEAETPLMSHTIGSPNAHVVAADGTLAFATPTPLVGADQNTSPPDASKGNPYIASVDVYEYRDGWLVLVTDGLTRWSFAPSVEGIGPAGRDIYFSATARYTPDAIDASRRIYTARIGGGIDFPDAPTPCPLEVCQGAPEGAPDDPDPSSLSFRGAGNPAAEPPSCAAPARRARRTARVARRHAGAAKRLRRAAARSSDARRTRSIRRRARRHTLAAKRGAALAKRQRARATRCRANAKRRASR